ncbi:hypothetical protein RPC_2297 [Rhodopseudomonas palustris BisB18]|uniref:Uncharacterized protein n=1 Tax=Rhodopseudomonas palustris (strain BisB18) TaxID=316056 RepID=Q215T5_RHOPB
MSPSHAPNELFRSNSARYPCKSAGFAGPRGKPGRKTLRRAVLSSGPPAAGLSHSHGSGSRPASLAIPRKIRITAHPQIPAGS